MRKGSSRLLLLDVNVLLALAWPNHQFHAVATRRMERSKTGWATCALTQLGFIRLSSNASVVGVSKTPWEAASLLALLVRDAGHVFLGSLPSPATGQYLRDFERIAGSKQVTDTYLVSLAKQRDAKLLTFDTRIALLGRSEDDIEVLSEI